MKPLSRLVACGLLWYGVDATASSLSVINNEWCRFQTSHFDMITDLEADRARHLLREMERFDSAVRQIIEQVGMAPQERLKVLVFERRRDFQRVFASRGFAGFMSSSLHENVLTLGPDRGGAHLHENALHEYTHHVLRNNRSVGYPLWYEEGYASYLSTMTFAEESVVLGDLAKHHVAKPHKLDTWEGVRIREVHHMSNVRRRQNSLFEQLLNSTSLQDWPPRRVDRFYEQSWLLVHLLTLGHAAGFTDRRAMLKHYLTAIGEGIESRDAFTRSFPEGYKSLEQDLARYKDHLQLPTLQVSVPAEDSVLVDVTGCLDGAQIAFELGLASANLNPRFAQRAFSWMSKHNADDARGYIGTSIISRKRGDIKSATRAAIRAVALDEDSAQAKVALAGTMVESCTSPNSSACTSSWQQAAELYGHALVLDPGRADAAFGLGVTRFLLGEPQRAIEHLRMAHERAPWAPRIQLFLGEAYRLAGQTTNARWHLSRAVRWETDLQWRDKAQQALNLLPST